MADGMFIPWDSTVALPNTSRRRTATRTTSRSRKTAQGYRQVGSHPLSPVEGFGQGKIWAVDTKLKDIPEKDLQW